MSGCGIREPGCDFRLPNPASRIPDVESPDRRVRHQRRLHKAAPTAFRLMASARSRLPGVRTSASQRCSMRWRTGSRAYQRGARQDAARQHLPAARRGGRRRSGPMECLLRRSARHTATREAGTTRPRSSRRSRAPSTVANRDARLAARRSAAPPERTRSRVASRQPRIAAVRRSC